MDTNRDPVAYPPGERALYTSTRLVTGWRQSRLRKKGLRKHAMHKLRKNEPQRAEPTNGRSEMDTNRDRAAPCLPDKWKT